MSERLLKINPPLNRLGDNVRIPGSKSYTNRALILASLASGASIINRPSYSDDSKVLISALEKLGVEFERQKERLSVKGKGGDFFPYKGEINVGPAGTTMRFLVSLCAAVEGAEVILLGSERMHQRPISDLVSALRTIGAQIEYMEREGCPPLRIKGKGDLKGGTVKVSGKTSSQYFSSLLMLAPLLKDGLIIEVDGMQISRSYIDMTLDSLKSFGVSAKNNYYQSYYVKGAELPKAIEYQVEGDASGASYFWAMAAMAGRTIRVQNINPRSLQGDIQFPRILEKMGCTVQSGFSGMEGWIDVNGGKALKGVNVDMTLMPDTAQTLAVLAATASSPTVISGLSTLRIKETDRILALQNELGALGVKTEATQDSIKIYPSQIGQAKIKTYDDHRMAMAFSVLAVKYNGIEIEDPEVVNKSFPEYWQLLKQLGFGLE